MVDVPKPVLSCFGHESLVSELESRLMQSLASEPALWRHSKWTSPYPVHIDVYFTRFDIEALQAPVKVLSTGRPIRPLGSMKPFLYIHVLSNNHTQYTHGTVKQDIAKWLGHLNAQNITDWLILMIDADSRPNATKVWSKLSVLDRIKQDFNVPAAEHHFLRVPDRRAVEEKVFSESWNTLMRSIRKILLDIFYHTIRDYETHIRLLLEAQGSVGWDFFEYLDRKEELAELYLFLRGYEDALHEYYDIESLLALSIRNSASAGSHPVWIDQLNRRSSQSASTCSFLSCFPVINSGSNSQQTRAVRNRTATLFDIRTYLLSKQSILLKSLKRLHEFPALALSRIVAAVQESRILKLCSVPEFEYCWTLLCVLDCLQLIRPRNVNPNDSVDISITNILAALPYSTHNHSLVLRSAVPSKPSDRKPSENVFLHASQSGNPLAEPIAKLVARTYAIIAPLTNSPEHERVADTLGRDQPFTSHLVDMWIIVVLQLTFLGQRLSYWSSCRDRTVRDPILQSIKLGINQCSVSHLSNPDDFAVSVHRHLNHLLSSKTTYSEVYISLAQIIVGFLHLTSQPRKSVHVSCLLANFLHYSNNEKSASDLYSSAISMCLNEGWICLSLRIYMQLACCLRTVIRSPRFQDDCEMELLLTRYIDCCFALGCASSRALSTVFNSMNVAASQEIILNTWFPDKLADSVTDLRSPAFWWSEAVRAQLTLPEHVVWDASFAFSTPFRVHQVHLKGANEDGTQCITLQLKNTSHLSFQVRIQAIAAFPTGNDWINLMEYGLMGRQNVDVDDVESNLTVVDYTLSVPPVNTSNLHSGLRPLDNSHSALLVAPKLGSPKLNPSRGDTSSLTPLTKRGSFFDLAASWATRPTWKSQDQLHSSLGIDPTHSQKASLNTKDHLVTYRLPSVSPLCKSSSRNLADTENASRLSMNRIASTTNLQDISLSSIDSAYLLDKTQERNFLSPSSAMIQPEPTTSFVPKHSDGFYTSTSTLHPGMNTLNLSATCPGFMLPVCLQISVLDWSCDGENTSRNIQCHKDAVFNWSYTLRRQHFSSSWKNRPLLDSLLPSLRNYGSDHEPFEPVTVILGLKQPILFDMKLGKLGLPARCCSPITLYRSVRTGTCAHSSPRHAATEPVRKIRGFSEYTVNPLTKHATVVVDGGESSDGQYSDGSIDPNYTHLDGPVDLCGESLHLVDCPQEEYFSVGAQLQMDRPLLLTVLTEMDEFAISMPFGYMLRLPVRIIKPLVMQLSVSAFQRTNAVILGLRIGCTDLPYRLRGKLNTNNDAEPFAFTLFDFQLTLNAPSVPNENQASDASKNPHTISVTPPQTVVSQTSIPFSSKEPATENLRLDSLDSLVGVLLDPNCNTVHVSPLCPVTLLWSFKLSDFRPFINNTRERFNKSPVAKFQCSFRRLGDTDSEAQLVFYRKISVRHLNCVR
ncbi:unnamed protein product [Dicrocoelium dendriticum]|nr:unnamed protein product [Dicrocoelium dendriticum]